MSTTTPLVEGIKRAIYDVALGIPRDGSPMTKVAVGVLEGVHSALADALTALTEAQQREAALQEQLSVAREMKSAYLERADKLEAEVARLTAEHERLTKEAPRRPSPCSHCGRWGKSEICFGCGRERDSGIKPFSEQEPSR